LTDADYTRARSTVIARQDPPAVLLEECRRIVGLLVRTSGLPPHYSPYGVWSDEAVDEVLADWIATRLIGRGQLLAMVQRAPVLAVFRRMAETSVRQHLVDSLRRSQASNLFERVTRQLVADERFEELDEQAGTKFWRLRGGPAEPFPADDSRLAALAFSLGEFRVIRYEPDARKLSPLLDSGELTRFLLGVLSAGPMSAASIMRALSVRFAIEEPTADQELHPDQRDGRDGPEGKALLDELVTATLAELSSRQAEVLVGLDSGMSGTDLAAQLGCSTGTISHERRRIEDILARLGTDAPAVLKLVLDALFIDHG
jgi:hypothetical protein